MKNDQIDIQKDQKTPINLFDTIVSSDRYDGEVYTPFNIAEDMINLLPPDQDKTFWNPNTTFLDIYCKSGVFLEILYRRLMGVLANFPGYEDEQVRSSHILNNQLFGLSPLDDGGLMLATRRVYGDIFHKNLIHYDIQNVMKDISSRAGKNFELYEQNLVNTLKQVTSKEFNKMNFNVVIGNPPYNRGGGTLISQTSVMKYRRTLL